MTTRDELRDRMQEKISKRGLELRNTILFMSMRLGKTRIALKMIEEGDRVLVIYPFNPIKKSWEEELEKFTPLSDDITFVNKASVHKYANQEFDLVIIDEPQFCQSKKQLDTIKSIKFKKRIALTGAMNSKTIKKLEEIGLTVGVTYSVEDAIRDKLVKDYRIYVHFKPLDDTRRNIQYPKFGRNLWGTEREVYDTYSETMAHFEEKKLQAQAEHDYRTAGLADLGYKKYMGLRTNFLYNSVTLFNETLIIKNGFKDKKALIYSLRTDIADALSSESYHSKNKEEEVLETFKETDSGHLAVVNCVQAGITIKKLNVVIFHSYESNEEVFFQKLARALLWEYEGEVAEIHIVCLEGTQMMKWIDSACRGLNQDKIHYVIDEEVFGKLEFIKMSNPDKELYLYNGAVVYKVAEPLTVTPGKYCFLDNPEVSYPIATRNLTKI